MGTPLLDAARQAFTHGLHVTAGVCVAIVVAGAVLTTVMLRRAGDEPSGGDVVEPDESGGPRDAEDRTVGCVS